jgi:hypothetical protein
MRFFVAEVAPQNDGGLGGAGGAAEAVAEPPLDRLVGAVVLGKAAAEPPHSKSSRRSEIAGGSFHGVTPVGGMRRGRLGNSGK